MRHRLVSRKKKRKENAEDTEEFKQPQEGDRLGKGRRTTKGQQKANPNSILCG